MKPITFIFRILTLVIISFLGISAVMAQWQLSNGPKGDKIFCFDTCGTDIYAGALMGTIYRSSDGGTNWSNIGANLTDGVTCLDVYNSTIYIGTGGEGAFKSTNNGATWTPIRSGIPYDGFFYGGIISIIVNGNLLYAGVSGYGLYRSSNGGGSWSQVSCGLTTNEGVSILKWINDTIYVLGESGTLITSPDNGTTWNTLFSLGTAVSFTLNGSDLFLGTYGDGVLFSDDQGLTWTPVNNGIPMDPVYTTSYQQIQHLFYSNGRLYASTVATYYGYDYVCGSVYVSTNNGLTWTETSSGIKNNFITNIFSNGSSLFAGSYSGIYSSANNGQTWQENNSGFPNMNTYGIFSDNSLVYAGTYEGGVFKSSDHGNTWQGCNKGLPQYNKAYALGGNSSIIYVGIQYSGVFCSTDYGENWSKVWNGSYPNIYRIEVSNNMIFVGTDYYLLKGIANGSPLSQVNAPGLYGEITAIRGYQQDVYVGKFNGIFHSPDNGVTWSQTNFPTGINGTVVDFMLSGNSLFAYIIDDMNGYIFRSNDNGTTWSVVNSQIITWGMMLSDNHYYLLGDTTKMIISSDMGIEFSSDAGNSFTLTTSGLAIWPQGFTIDDSLAWLSTYIGVYTRPLSDFVTDTVSGTVFLDLNNNSIQDAGESGMTGVTLALSPGGIYSSSDTSGNYSFSLFTDLDTVFVYAQSPYASVNPSYYVFSHSDTALDFAVFLPPDLKDLRVSLTNTTPARPGFNVGYRLTYQNNGSIPMNGSVQLVFDANLDYLNSNPLMTLLGDTLTLNFSNLAPLEVRNCDIVFNLSALIPLGTVLLSSASVLPIQNDTIPDNNTCLLSQTVVGSYDPNEKEVLPADGISPLQVATGEEIIYTIHFQNTGTDTAFTVKITDTLDANIEVTSFQFISSSHPCTFNLKGNGIIEFYFSNILLPDSNTNEMLSHGYARFSVKPKPTLQLGQEIDNTAYIFFDYNSPVVTNTTQTLVQIPVSVYNTTGSTSSLLLYPNPASNEVTLKWTSGGNPVLSILTLSGRCIYSKQIENGKSAGINVSGFPKGVYIVKVVGKEFVETRKLILQ